ncbi:protease inhibitor I42 family protein [Chloroflexota bacterium]
MLKVALLCFLGNFLGFLLAACSTSPLKPKIVIVDENMDSEFVELFVNDQIEIRLPGNPTTGYDWILLGVDYTILEKLGELEYQSEGDTVGGGGHYTLKLRAVAPGQTLVELAYRRSFESEDIPSADEFKILVRVK